MLDHLNPISTKPARAVVIGWAGFVGGAVARRLERDGVGVLRVGRAEVDLLSPGAADKLAGLLRAGDAVIAAAAIAPCKTAAMLRDNMIVAANLVAALATAPVAHVVNISSDAVYADLPEPLTESSWTAPGSLHGAMHLARERMFQAEIKAPLATLRPSLIYGARDPHDGYGPNRFRRLANRGEDIVLFGEGEERRDHVCIDDLAELVARILDRRSTGVLNVATGEVHSFHSIAAKVAALAPAPVAVKSTPRSGPLPHNGYRPFDPAGVQAAFPGFRFTGLDQGLAQAQKEEFG